MSNTVDNLKGQPTPRYTFIYIWIMWPIDTKGRIYATAAHQAIIICIFIVIIVVLTASVAEWLSRCEVRSPRYNSWAGTNICMAYIYFSPEFPCNFCPWHPWYIASLWMYALLLLEYTLPRCSNLEIPSLFLNLCSAAELF